MHRCVYVYIYMYIYIYIYMLLFSSKSCPAILWRHGLQSSVHGISHARILEWIAFPSPGDHPNPGIEPMSPPLAGGFVTTQPRESESESHSVLLDSLWPHGLSDQISCSVVSDSLRPHESQHARPWNSPGQRTGVGSHSLLQGIFATQILNPGLLHCRQILYQLSLGRHRILVSCFFT